LLVVCIFLTLYKIGRHCKGMVFVLEREYILVLACFKV
jgi:hypothetical protein